MAFSNINLDDLTGFGKRLLTIARERELDKPNDIAANLYKKYPDFVKPASRRTRGVIHDRPEEKDLQAITRNVQRHFNEPNVCKVPSNYLYAYSQLFNCSLDYLYGKTSFQSEDPDVEKICHKLGLSEKAVLNLINGLKEGNESFSPTSFWSSVLESDCFSSNAYRWYFYASALLELKTLKEKIGTMRKLEGLEKDSFQKEMIEVKCESLEKIYYEKAESCEGSLYHFLNYISSQIAESTDKWVKFQHQEYSEMYYESERNKIEILEAVLKDESSNQKP